MKRCLLMALVAICGISHAQEEAPAPRPNIVWISFEDISPNWGCYGDDFATTPNLDKLASEGIRFTRAFSVAGVCAPSRSGIITGMHPQSINTHHMRSKAVLPEHVRCFPAYLRDAGYYCTNNSKTDYNFDVPEDAWDENGNKAHWRNKRKKNQPFFSVFNFTESHESKICTAPEDLESLLAELGEEWHDPAKVKLPPYYPDTPLMRRQWAHYYDLMTIIDNRTGQILKELEEDGLLENTIIFAFGDHGAGAPRAKRWLYDSGIQVPLVVRLPGNVDAGTVNENLVSLIDLAPTVLKLAGVEIPKHFHGQAFLGDVIKKRDYIFAGRDRMDERYDIIRAVRNERFKYIRNYDLFRPYDQYLSYPESHVMMPELRRAKAEGELNAEQLLFFRQQKPLEEFYDLENDPYELNNLSNSSLHAETLQELRMALNAWMDDMRDPALIPESMLADWPEMQTQHSSPTMKYKLPDNLKAQGVFGTKSEAWLLQLNEGTPLERLEAIRALSFLGVDSEPILRMGLLDPLPAIAYWAAVGIAELDCRESVCQAALRTATLHPHPAVQIAAAQALAKMNFEGEVSEQLIQFSQDPNSFIRHLAVMALESFPIKSGMVLKALDAATKDTYDYARRVAMHASGMN